MTECSPQVVISRELLEHVGAEVLRISEEMLLPQPEHSSERDFRLDIERIDEVIARIALHTTLPHEEEIFAKLNMALDLFENTNINLPTSTRIDLITKQQLQYLLENNFKVREMAEMFSVCERTIRRRMSQYGLFVRQTYTDITDQSLRDIIGEIMDNFPDIGTKMIKGHLAAIGVRVQEQRIREAIRAEDPIGTVLRGLRNNVILRQPYSVPAPLSLWHIDGYHKLIRWRIVVHGGIDGYSRKVMFLKANNNNRASTVLESFVHAVHTHGLPDCVRSDKGGENVEVARFMLENPHARPDQQTFITGKSVHNQRIERLWRDVWQGVAKNYYQAFRHLEECGALDPGNELHHICLQHVMLPRLNRHLKVFSEAWDSHPLSSEGGKSPQQLWFQGQLLNRSQIPDVIHHTGPVPTSYYVRDHVKVEYEQCVSVSRGSTTQLDYEILFPGCVLRWQFASEGADIGFGVFVKSKLGEWKRAGQMTEVVHSQRYNAHLVPEDGSLTCDRPGVYVLRFDNTYSLFQAKRISFTVEVLLPDRMQSPRQQQACDTTRDITPQAQSSGQS